MISFIKRKIGMKVTILVNVFILLVMTVGTVVLVAKQRSSLEEELLNRGRIQSIVGAKMIGQLIEEAVDNGVFSVKDAFDTDYQPIGNFDPPKYHTQYDFYLDKAILSLQDEFLQDESVIFAVAVDKNGYLPTHNTRFQQPITGDVDADRVGNRTKRIFDDPVGITAAKNLETGFQQIYHRDTGETMWDISSPIFVKGKHWGGFRIGFSLDAINSAKNQLMQTLIMIMGTVLLLSLITTFFAVNRALSPLRLLTKRATQLASGRQLGKALSTRRTDEIGKLQGALDRLRMSMVIAIKKRRK